MTLEMMLLGLPHGSLLREFRLRSLPRPRVLSGGVSWWGVRGRDTATVGGFVSVRVSGGRRKHFVFFIL